MKRRILNHLGLVAALAAIAVLMTVGLMSILFGCARTLYWLPSTSDIVGVLLIWLTAVWVVAGLVLAPPRRPRRTDPRAPRSPEWDGVAVRPAAMVSAAERGLGSISGASARTSPAGGRAGLKPPPSPSPTWRSA